MTDKGIEMSRFDEEPDGDPHGECAAEIDRLETVIRRAASIMHGGEGVRDQGEAWDCAIRLLDAAVMNMTANSKSLRPLPPIDWLRVEQAEALGLEVHVTPAIDEECDHKWEGADGNPERCSKCGLSFTRYIHSCCP